MAEGSVNDQLLDRAIRHAVFLERLKTHEVNNIMTEFNNELTPAILEMLEKGLKKGLSKKKLRQLASEYTKLNKSGFKSLAENLKGDLKEIALNESNFTANLFQTILPIEVAFTTAPDVGLLNRIATNSPIRGKLLDTWMKELGEQTASRISQQINIGLAEGEGIEQIVRRIKGTRTAQFQDGILNTSRRHVRTLVRTSVNDVTTKAREEFYRMNDDIIKKVRFEAVLDSRTTVICASLDGRLFDIGEGPRPPLHMNCRSVTTPVTRSHRELGIDLDEAPRGTRASRGSKKTDPNELKRLLDGQVPADLTYPEWLKKQPIEVQNEVLGKGRAQLFRRGKVSFDRFVDRRNRPLSLKRLKKIEKELETAK